MTDVVVTSESNTTIISQQPTNNVVVDSAKQPTTIVTGIMGPRGATQIADSNQFDLTQLAEGSLLVYNSTSQKWVATNLLDHQIVESGQF